MSKKDEDQLNLDNKKWKDQIKDSDFSRHTVSDGGNSPRDVKLNFVDPRFGGTSSNRSNDSRAGICICIGIIIVIIIAAVFYFQLI